MLNKSSMAVAAAGMVVTLALPTLVEAATARSAKLTGDPAKIACMGEAVAAREAALTKGIETLTKAMNANYAARARALADAYKETATGIARNEIRDAWTSFKNSQRSAQRVWKDTRETAWKMFRTEANNCRASSDLNDSSNTSLEASGA